MTVVVRTVFADQFPKGADLEQAARDSLIRYCRQFDLVHDGPVWLQWGSKWVLRDGYWDCRLDVDAVRIEVETQPRPVEGEVVEGPFCPLCPHRLADHYRETYACMVSTETEPWACSCPGTADR